MRVIYAILIVVVVIFVFAIIAYAWDWGCRKINKPRIGSIDCFLYDLLKRNDYVCIEGEVLQFSHIVKTDEIIDVLRPPLDNNKALGGELAFDKRNSLGYIIYPTSVLRKCEFIYGKYGLKWAASKELAAVAKEKVYEYIWN